jgi:hypothetical protein
MVGGTLSSSDPFSTVINQEAAKQGKSAIASQFIANVVVREKGGSYDVCPAAGNCNPPYSYDRSNAGVLTLPFKSAGTIVPHAYAFGNWVNNVEIPCQFNTTCAARTQADNVTRQLLGEQFRAQIKAALKTW